MPWHFLVVCVGLLLTAGVLSSGCGDSSATSTTVESTGVPAEDQDTAAAAIDADAGLRAAMDRWVVESTGPGGIAVAVLRPDGSMWTGAAGVVDAATGAEMEPDQLMRAGSITKSFVAAVMLQLMEEGKLELDGPVVALWPDFTGDETITVRHLLAHTSGIYNYSNCIQDQDCLVGMLMDAAGITDLGDCQDKACLYEGLEDAGLVLGPDVLLERALAEPASFPPGTGYEYSNTNYLVLCNIIESLTGQLSHTELRARLYEQLGLDDTYLAGLEDGPPFAPGFGDSSVADITEDIELFFCAGGLVSTVEDLAVFGDALWGGNLLDDASLEVMVTPAYRPTEGLGTVFQEFAAQPAWGHLGGAPGFIAALYHLPESDITIAAMSNSDVVVRGIQPAIDRINAFVGEIAETVMP